MSRDDGMVVTQEQRDAWREMGPGRFRDPGFQSYVQSFRTQKSLSEAGKEGWRVTSEKYGRDVATKHLRSYRLEHPSSEERKMIGVLNDAGISGYEREMPLCLDGKLFFADFAWPDTHKIVEVYGGVHFGPFFDSDGTRAARDAVREVAIRDAGWEVLTIKPDDLTATQRPYTVQKVQDFIEGSTIGEAQGDDLPPF